MNKNIFSVSQIDNDNVSVPVIAVCEHDHNVIAVVYVPPKWTPFIFINDGDNTNAATSQTNEDPHTKFSLAFPQRIFKDKINYSDVIQIIDSSIEVIHNNIIQVEDDENDIPDLVFPTNNDNEDADDDSKFPLSPSDNDGTDLNITSETIQVLILLST